MAALAMVQLAEMCMLKAELRQAFEIYQQALEMATTPEGQPLPGAGMVHAGLAVLAYQWNDLETTGQHISESLRLSQQLGEAGTFDGYVMLARLKQARGDTAGAFEALQLGQQFIRRFSAMGNLVLDALRVRLWLDEGNLSAAAGWAQVYRQNPAVYGLTPVETGIDGGSIPAMYYPYEMGQLCLARVLLAQARHSGHGSALTEARRLLAVLGQQAEQLGRVSTTIEVLMLQALAAHMGQEKDRAVSLLEQALALARPGGYVRLFIDEGQPMADLLAILAERSSGERRAYIERLLAAPGLEAPVRRSGPASPGEPAPKTGLSAPHLVEPLSERELEVLRLIAAGRSNRDIARVLVLAPGTVKKHTSNLYGKLGVHSRTQALARARALGLLDD
jgi:LuxR family maltose regulon positive regulatory protein